MNSVILLATEFNFSYLPINLFNIYTYKKKNGIFDKMCMNDVLCSPIRFA